MGRDAEFPATIPGVSKVYLHQYVAMFEWGYNAKRATTGFVRALLGVEDATGCPT